MRVTADSNVYISAIYYRGRPLELIRRAVDKDFDLFISTAILQEILRVMREKFNAAPEDLQRTRDFLLDGASLVPVTSVIDAVKDDPSDNRILECAVDSGSEYIVTGDRHLLRFGEYAGIKIVKIDYLLSILAERR